MKTVGRFQRTPTPHTGWCAQDHRGGVTEHRSADLIAALPGAGRAVITRVRSGDIEYAEIRARIPLHTTETGARWQLATLLWLLGDVLAAVAIRPGQLRSRPSRRPLGRGSAA